MKFTLWIYFLRANDVIWALPPQRPGVASQRVIPEQSSRVQGISRPHLTSDGDKDRAEPTGDVQSMLKTARDGLRGPPRLPRRPHACCLQVSGTLSVAVQRGRGGPGMLRGRRGDKQRASRAGGERRAARPGRGLALCAAGAPAEAARLCARSLWWTRRERPRNVCATIPASPDTHRRSVELEAVAGSLDGPGRESCRAQGGAAWTLGGRTSEKACVLVQAGEGGTHTQNQGEE